MPIFDTKYNLNAQIFNLCRIFLVTVSLLVLSTLSMANVSMQNHSVANPLLEFDRENIMQNKPSTSDNGLTNAEKILLRK